jgi:repressor of nif and glnA expression
LNLCWNVYLPQKQQLDVTDYLLPRRAEIYKIIEDQTLVSFDQLHRRFMAINPRTLRYDLKKLQDANLIRKRGTTKGVFYEKKG